MCLGFRDEYWFICSSNFPHSCRSAFCSFKMASAMMSAVIDLPTPVGPEKCMNNGLGTDFPAGMAEEYTELAIDRKEST